MLYDLAGNNPGAPVRIVNAGAISPLVALLGKSSETPETREEAVGALSCLAENDPSNQLAIATGLVGLLALEGEEAKEQLALMVRQFSETTDIRTATRTSTGGDS